MGNRCKYIITILVILPFLCQNFAWAYGQDKLAPRSRASDHKLEAAARGYAEMLTEKKGKPIDPDDGDNLPPTGSVLRSIIAFILIPVLVFMLLISPVNINTSFAQISPQWRVDLEEVLRLKKEVGLGFQFDSYQGGFLSGSLEDPSGGATVNVGVGNPLIGYSDEGTGVVGTAFLGMWDEWWFSLRGGILPDYTHDSTLFSVVGVDTKYRLLRPYLHVGALRRELDGAYGKALGILVDGGLRLDWKGLDVALSGSGPLYLRPVAGTAEVYRRVISDLSLLRTRLKYKLPPGWIGGTAELGGLESRFDPGVPSNGFSRYGLDVGLRFDVGQVKLAWALLGEWLNPSYTEEGAIVVRPSVDITWRDLSLRGGVWFGPFVRPYGEVMYRLIEYVELTAGYNGMPPIYHKGFFKGPFNPRNLFTFNVRIDTQPGRQGTPHSEYPVQGPTGTAMRRFVYGPPERYSERIGDDFERAVSRFEGSLKEAVTRAKTAGEAMEIYKRLKEDFPFDTEELSIVFYRVWNAFWHAFYENPDLDLYWMYTLRKELKTDEDVYKTWHENGYSYNDIVMRLLDRRYEVPDMNSLRLLIREFNETMAIAGVGAEQDVLIGLFGEWRGRLSGIEPGGPVFVWTYYVASRLFAVLVGRNVYPGTEELADLIEANLKIPPDLTGLNIGVVVPDEGLVDELHSNVLEWISSDNLDIQIQGLLVLEYLLGEKGDTIITDGISTRLEMILRGPMMPELAPLSNIPREVPPITKESEQFKRLKAAIIALDILIRIKRPPGKDALDWIMKKYEELPPELRKELRFGEVSKLIEIREEQKGEPGPETKVTLGKHASLVLPFFAGLFLTGCSGTGVGAGVGIGILLSLVAVASMVDTKTTASTGTPERPEKRYNPTGNKAVDAFLEAITDKKTILALDTDIGNLRDPATSLLATLERLSRHGQLGGITFIRAEGTELRKKVEKAVVKDKDVNIILVCKNTNRERFNGLENVFITSVDDSNKVGTYIPILEILTLSLKMASRTDIDEVKGLYKKITGEDLSEDVYAGKSLSLILPRSESVDYEDPKVIYESQNEVLLSA